MYSSQNHDNHEQTDELSLQELFMALWKQKKLIIAVTVIAGIVTGLISMLAITPVYHSRLNIIMNMPETYQTKYGDYSLPISSNEQYINLITSSKILQNTMKDMGYDPQLVFVETLRERVSIILTDNKNSIQNSFDIRVSSNNPEDARGLAQILYENYIEFLDVMLAEAATDYFANYYDVLLRSLEVEIETNQELLANNEELLNKTPMTINQREAMNAIVDFENSADFIVMGNIINPNYTELELDIIEIKQTINSLEKDKDIYSIYLDELNDRKLEILKYYEDGEFTKLKGEIVRITKSNIYLPSDPLTPSKKTSPSNSRSAIIGAFLGAVVSVLIALIKEFWFNKYTND